MAELGEEHVQEHSTKDALFSIDLALPGRVLWAFRSFSNLLCMLQQAMCKVLLHIGQHTRVSMPALTNCLLPGENIALEVDGPHHFTTNTRQPTGKPVCKQVISAQLPLACTN